MGIAGEFEHPRFQQALDAVIAACRKHGVVPAYLVSKASELKACYERGFRVLSVSYDIGLFTAALADARREMESIL